MRIPAILSGRDAEDLEHLYLDALALIEMAPGGSGPVIARAMLARQERAMRLQTGMQSGSGPSVGTMLALFCWQVALGAPSADRCAERHVVQPLYCNVCR